MVFGMAVGLSATERGGLPATTRRQLSFRTASVRCFDREIDNPEARSAVSTMG
jgi:hypothetical protein